MTLGFSITSSQDSQEYKFREEAGLSVTCAPPKSADEFNATYVYPLQNLMTFVCDRAQEVERFSVRQGALLAGSPEIRVIGPRVLPEEDEEAPAGPVRRFQMLFTFEDVEFADLLGRWLRLTDVYADACSVFFGLQYGPPTYIDLTFACVVQALSLYYARREDGLAQRAEEEKRLRGVVAALTSADAEWIVDHLGPRPFPPVQSVLHTLVHEHSTAMNPLLSHRQDRFVNEVMNTLHYIIHRDSEVGFAASYGSDLYWLMQKLRFLMKSCFLRELGLTAEKAQKLFDRNALYQHVCRLETTRESARKSS